MSVADELILLGCDILEYCFLREIKLLEKKQQRRQNRADFGKEIE